MFHKFFLQLGVLTAYLKLSSICGNQQVLTKTGFLTNQKNWLSDFFILTLILGLFYSAWSGSYPLFTPDEGRYSEVAREMLVSGDYVTPRLNGVAFLDKPALYYWLQASAIKIFGLTEGALRFWPSLLGILSMLITYSCGRLIFSRRTGLLSAVILATTPLYYGGAHYANLDLEVASLISDSLLCFIAAIEGNIPSLRKFLLIAAYIFAGLAVLTKGLIGIAFPMMIIGSWVLLLNRWSLLKKMHLFFGLSIFTLIALPWYILVQKANPQFLHFFFVTQQVSRFLTMQDFNSKAAVWFYVPVVALGFFPWICFLIQAVSRKIKLIYTNPQAHASELYLLLWFFIVFTFFSIPRSKTVGYILPIFPVMALIVGNYLDNMWDQQKKGISVGKFIFVALAFLVGSTLVFVFPHFSKSVETPTRFVPYLQAMGGVLLLGSLITFALFRKNLKIIFSCMLLTMVALLLTFICSATSMNDKSIKPLALILKSQLKPEDEIVAYYKYYHDLPIYLERRITIVADWDAKDIPNNDNWVREMWYGMPFQDTSKWLIRKNDFLKRFKDNKRMFVITDIDYFKDLKSKMPTYKIAEQGDIVLLTNKPTA